MLKKRWKKDGVKKNEKIGQLKFKRKNQKETRNCRKRP